MIRTRFKKVLLVAPEIFPDQLVADYKHVVHIDVINHIFPAIFKETPTLIILDYNYIGKDIEKIIRRIRSNNFYNKIKICCYKTKPQIKTDDLLKAIGVDYFIYSEELKIIQKSNNLSHIFDEILDRPVLGMAPNI